MPAKPRKAAAKTTAKKAAQPAVEPEQPVDAEPVEDADAQDEPNAADTAAAEVLDDGIVVPFRGVDFVIPNKRRSGAKVMMALRSATTDPLHHTHTLLHSLLGKVDSVRFLDLLEEDDDIWAVSREFFDSMNAAAGTGNS